MATTSIWAITGTAAAIRRVEMYIENPEKTIEQTGLEYQSSLHQIDQNGSMIHEYSLEELEQEKVCYVSGINCTAPNDACEEFAAVYDLWGKPCKGRVCYHGYQSFREGEVTAEQAHEIGVRLAEQLWGDRFQVVVATHLNTGHYHNHIMLNAISFADGYKFVNRKSDYQQMREVSDDLCREYGLSVIEHPGQSGKHYGEWKAEQEGRPTQRGDIRLDLDAAIEKLGSKPTDRSRRQTVRGDIRLDFDAAAMQSDTIQDLIRQMEEMGYTWNFSGKYPKIKPPGKDRYFRLYKLGTGYDSLETLAKRVLHMQETTSGKRRMPSTYYRYHGSFRKRKKGTGFVALYYYHCYRIGVFAKRTYPKYTPEFREAQKQLHEMSKAAAFLNSADIHSKEQFQSYREKLNREIQLCDTQIKELQQQLVASNDPAENEALVHQLDRLHQQQQNFAEQKRLCKIVAQQQVQEEATPQPQETEPTAPKKQSGAIGVD